MENPNPRIKEKVPHCQNCGKPIANGKLYANKYCYICYMLKAKFNSKD